MKNDKFACSLGFEVSPGTLCLRSIRLAIDTMRNASDTTILSLAILAVFNQVLAYARRTGSFDWQRTCVDVSRNGEGMYSET
jgi:hypothetical protein